MVRSTTIARASDALPLAASVDDEQVSMPSWSVLATSLTPLRLVIQTETTLQEHKQQAKLIFRRINAQSEPRCSIESDAYTLQYVLGSLSCVVQV